MRIDYLELMKRALLLSLLLGCDQPPTPPAPAATETTVTTSSKPPRPHAPRVATLFAGLPSRGAVGNKPIALPKARMLVRLPPAWRRKIVGDEVRLWSEEKNTAFITIISGLDEVDDKLLERVAKQMKIDDVAWQEPVPARLGSRRMPAVGAEGLGKLEGSDMRLWRFDATTPANNQLLVFVAVLPADTGALAAVSDCLRTLHPKQ
jgi:hypothetical protein